MIAGWQTKTLEDACHFSNGLWKGEKPPFVNVGVIRNTNFTKEGTLDDSDIAYLDVEVRKLEKRRLQFGDIILEKSGGGPRQPVGRVALFDKEDGDFSFSNFTAAIRVLDPRELDFRFLHKFLHYTYLSGVTEGMQSHSTGIRNLDGDAYKAIAISFLRFPSSGGSSASSTKRLTASLPPRPTPKRTSTMPAPSLKAISNPSLPNVAKDGRKSRFRSFVTLNMASPSRAQFFTDSGDYVLLTPGNFYESGGYRDRGEKQKYYSGEIPEAFVLSEGDMLVAMTEQAAGLLGSPIIVPESGKFLHNQRLGLVTKKPGVPWINEFFFYVFNTQAVRRAIHVSASGVKVRHTSPTKIGDVVVSFPTSLSEQRAIVSTLDDLKDKTQHLESLYQHKLAAMDELKKSLLHQAFTGQL